MTLTLPFPVRMVARAVDILLDSGDITRAAAVMQQVDEDQLRAERAAANASTRGLRGDTTRPPHKIPRADALRIHARNQFTCRYDRCGYTPTLDEDVLKVLGRLGAFTYYRSEPRGWHQLAWTYQAAPEHVVPRSPVPSDWTTACWTCNAAKSDIPLERLGWRYDPEPPDHTWSGLREHLPALERLALRPGPIATARVPSHIPISEPDTRRREPSMSDSAEGPEPPSSPVSKAEAVRRNESGRWDVRSFHKTNDSPPDGALVVAARRDGAPRSELTSRGALRTHVIAGSGPYISRDGRWRTRYVEATDELAGHAGWSYRKPWVLEYYVDD